MTLDSGMSIDMRQHTPQSQGLPKKRRSRGKSKKRSFESLKNGTSLLEAAITRSGLYSRPIS